MKLLFPLSKSLSIGGGGWMQASARAEAQQTVQHRHNYGPRGPLLFEYL
jgi:hypothetical protein